MSELRPQFRFATRQDIPGIEKLWLEETDWGALPLKLAEQWDAAPGGTPRTLIAVNESDGSILGQFGFVPVLIKVGDREVPGLRPHSTIVSRAFRSSVTTLDPADQPAVAMYMYGIQTLRNEGFSIAYMIPHPRWVGLFRIHRNLQRGYFPLFSISVDSVRSLKLTRGYTVSGLELSDAGIDDLWRQWAPQYACGIVRNASALKWKMDIDRYCALAVNRRGDLVGVVIARTRGDGMWLICDMLTADPGESLKATILAAAIAGTSENVALELPPEKKMRKVSIVATPLMRPTLDSLGFAPDDWTFPLIVERLDDSVSAEDVEPPKWYIAAND